MLCACVHLQLRMHKHAWPDNLLADVMLPNPGDYHYRHGGEAHYNSPQAMAELQAAVLHRKNRKKGPLVTLPHA